MTTYTGSQSCTLEKHSTFWFEDGSIIVSAVSNKRPLVTILFKVHKSILSMHSIVLNDMFTVSDDSEERKQSDEDTVFDDSERQNQSGEDGTKLPVSESTIQQVYEGVPVVEVQDNAEDWVTILKTMYGNAL